MNIEDKITELLKHAEPLRLLDDDDEGKRPLTGIVDEVNTLRALQSKGVTDIDDAEAPKPKRGRPAAKVEGDDAE